MMFFTNFKDTAAQNDINFCRDYIKNYGETFEINKILNNTSECIKSIIKKNLPFPIFLLFISLIAYISISILMIYKKIDEMSIYHLVGCSKKRIN
jgi:hypothetical protein